MQIGFIQESSSQDLSVRLVEIGKNHLSKFVPLVALQMEGVDPQCHRLH